MHRIFDHCDTETLLFSIRRISKYICAVVETYDRFALSWTFTSKFDDDDIFHLIQAEQVVSLSFLANQDMSRFDINQFTRLRSLTLIGICTDELEKLFSTMTINSLTSMWIHLGHMSNDQTLIPSLSQFNNLSLSQFAFNEVNKGIRWMMSASFEKLKYLQINICSYNEYVILLYHLPNLRIFRINNYTMKESTLNLNVEFYSSLKSLLITNGSITSIQLESLVKLTPKLQYLMVKNDKLRKFDSIFDGLFWEQLVISQLNLLDKLDFFFSTSSYNDQINDLRSIILPFQTPFWTNKTYCSVTCTFVIELCQIWLYSTPKITPNIEFSVRCEISSVDGLYRFISGPIHIRYNTRKNQVCI
ncbi:unnamed protein product [Rotaria sp. Silwood1]|nr:unnamed protein product [Rotaria sp. Silwood1]CAF4976005.1 unnamed protein product [Rotaria sp. Silwood1]